MQIRLENISKKFKNQEVLSNVNMEFQTGKIYGFKGRNGSGKSVLLKIICGLYKSSTGNIYINDLLVNTKDIYKYNIRALIENSVFFPNLSGYQNLKMLAEINNKINKEDIIYALETVNLEADAHKKFGEYSLGMKQKLGIAQAIMENPDILILDEPFNAIDDASVVKIKKYLLSIKDSKIIIVTSHIKEDLDDLCDKVYSFSNGVVSE